MGIDLGYGSELRVTARNNSLEEETYLIKMLTKAIGF